ncbi:DnaJ domain containing protein [Sesbania bispinosa]|nr:DnaJ domain containing protein [Sesbania bispinosa]
MDALSLTSSLSISKQFQCLPLSSKQQRTSQVHFSVSCRSTTISTKGNFYKMLSLSPGSATKDEIKRAYRSMALQYHPDVCHDPSMKEESTRMFVQLNTAYETLSNPVLRAQYDCELGLRNNMVSVSGDERWGEGRWQEQVIELKKRSRRRMGQKGGSWGTRMRTHMKERN